MLIAILSFLLILSFLRGCDIHTLDICTYLFLISLRNMPKDYYICKVSVSVCMPIEQLIGFCERTTTQWLLLLSSIKLLRSKPVQRNCLHFFKILKNSACFKC